MGDSSWGLKMQTSSSPLVPSSIWVNVTLSHTQFVWRPLSEDMTVGWISSGEGGGMRSDPSEWQTNKRTNERTDEMSNGRSTLTPPTKSIDAPARKLTRPSFDRARKRAIRKAGWRSIGDSRCPKKAEDDDGNDAELEDEEEILRAVRSFVQRTERIVTD